MSQNNVYNATPATRTTGVINNITETDAVGNAKGTLATALDDVNDSITNYPKCSYVNTAASVLVKTGAGQLYGIVVNSFTATATIKVWDNTAASGTVLLETITLAAGDRFIPLLGATFGTGCYVTIAVAAANITILYR